ncbi:MAG TPA: choice-of-anchor D domain-containing protein, partial [Solirubrobacteraceae bacterium]|nr:choice-of-anchor D domain-containing protein [Solirubrobacteraceae bacterium]
LGNDPRAQVDPTPRAFVAAVGTTSAAQQVVLTNTGSADLTLTLMPVVIGSNFAVSSTNCAGTLAAGASCSAQVAFAPPAATGGFSAKLRFSTNDPVSPTLDVPLTGTGIAAGTTPPPGGQTPPPGQTTTPGDSDGDQVVDSMDLCPTIAGDLKNGCPSELNAEITGRWRVNSLLSQLISLSVNTTIGSRIDLRCSGDHKKCGFTKRTIFRTTRRQTSLTHYFKGKRILSSGANITVRVTRPQQTGTYKRLVTRKGRRLPKVTQGCLSARTGTVTRCA